jgi:hypothetical protein
MDREGSPPPSPPGEQRVPPSPPGEQRMEGLPGLMRSMARPTFRKSFNNDPRRAIEQAGLNVQTIPPAQLEVLAGLSEEELEIVARVVSNLRSARPSMGVSL